MSVCHLVIYLGGLALMQASIAQAMSTYERYTEMNRAMARFTARYLTIPLLCLALLWTGRWLYRWYTGAVSVILGETSSDVILIFMASRTSASTSEARFARTARHHLHRIEPTRVAQALV